MRSASHRASCARKQAGKSVSVVGKIGFSRQNLSGWQRFSFGVAFGFAAVRC